MNEKEAAPHQSLEERLAFAQLMADLSAGFVNVPGNQVGSKILDAQRRLVEAYDLDRSALWERPDRKPETLWLSSLYQAGTGRTILERPSHEIVSSREWMDQDPSDNLPFPLGVDCRVFYPWACAQLLLGKPVVISRVSELPPDAAPDNETHRRSGLKSGVMLPLLIGGDVIGALTVVTIREERAWPDSFLRQFHAIAHVFAEALNRSHADRRLHQNEARLHMAAASAGARFWELEMRSGRLWVTDAAKDLYRISREEEMTFERFLGLIHPDDRERVRDLVQHRVQVGQNVQFEYRAVRPPDGRIEWVSATGHLHPGAPGESDRLMGVAIDITEKKQKDLELEARLQEIEALKRQLENENVYLREEVIRGQFEEMVGQSAALQAVFQRIAQVAPTDTPVLITGETGTGKELVARAIHRLSRRKDRVLVKVDCAALPASLIEGELFGREKGAYTGALTKQLGRFEVAHGSTLFLDEIGELPLELQAKLLRVVQDGEFERLGNPKTLRADVRLIAATNRDLSTRVKEGAFRQDLYYRLNVFPIQVPPLRDRPEDVPLLIWAFVRDLERKLGKRIESLPKKITEALQRYTWPGNIRELRNVVEQALIVTRGDQLALQVPGTPEDAALASLKTVERRHILSVLEQTGGHIKGPGGAAELLGMKPSTVYSAMRRLGIPLRQKKDDISS